MFAANGTPHSCSGTLTCVLTDYLQLVVVVESPQLVASGDESDVVYRMCWYQNVLQTCVSIPTPFAPSPEFISCLPSKHSVLMLATPTRDNEVNRCVIDALEGLSRYPLVYLTPCIPLFEQSAFRSSALSMMSRCCPPFARSCFKIQMTLDALHCLSVISPHARKGVSP